MTTEESRKEFEEWAKTQPRIREGLRLIRDSEGNYMSDDAEIAWESWQAAQKGLTEQRDGLRSGIDYASDQLHKVTEQRDRMAVLLSDIYNYAKGKKPHDYSKLTESDRIIAAFDAWQEIECKIEELLQTTPTQTEPK
jgi:hypothetical protein